MLTPKLSRAPTYQASAQFTQTQAQDAQPAAPETPEPTNSQGQSGRSYRVRKHKRNPRRRRPTAMKRDESTSQRFSQSPGMGDEAASAEAAGERQPNQAEEEAEARGAAIEKARQERIDAQQSGWTQLEVAWRGIIQGSQPCKPLVYSLALHRTACRRRKRCGFEAILHHTICTDSTSIVRVFRGAFETSFRVYIHLLCAYLEVFVDHLCSHNCSQIRIRIYVLTHSMLDAFQSLYRIRF